MNGRVERLVKTGVAILGVVLVRNGVSEVFAGEPVKVSVAFWTLMFGFFMFEGWLKYKRVAVKKE
jgi:divalent metal cation (Fe/Co/Zn/Cd) transporter